MRAVTSGPFKSSTSVTATEAPFRASNSQIASPIPDAPPVTSATLPFTCPVIFFSLLLFLVVELSDHGRPRIRHCDVGHAQLYALRSLKSIDRERARHMQG